MKTKVMALMLVAAGAAFAQFNIGVRIGAPPPARVVRVQPQSPGADYAFVNGYWYPVGNHYKWHEGYYTRPPYSGARWVEPHHDGQQYYQGYWDGDRGQTGHGLVMILLGPRADGVFGIVAKDGVQHGLIHLDIPQDERRELIPTRPAEIRR